MARLLRPVLLALLCVGCPRSLDAEASLSASTAIAAVNGVAITARELVEAQQRLRSRLQDPAELRAAALADCIDWQVRLQFAHAHGVDVGTADADVRAAFSAENERRARMKSAGQPIYGPRELRWPEFRVFWLDQVERDARSAIDRAAGDETEIELRDFYRSHTALFTAPKKTSPEPFGEIRDQVRDEYRKARYARLLAEFKSRVRVRTDDASIATLTPTTILPAAKR